MGYEFTTGEDRGGWPDAKSQEGDWPDDNSQEGDIANYPEEGYRDWETDRKSVV